MKQFFRLTIGATIIGLVCLGIGHWFNSQDNTKTEKEVYVYNWGEYVDPGLIKKFEKETDIQVAYETFDSNGAMEAKIKNGGTRYDVAFPGEYTVQKLKREHLLEPLDHQRIPNIKNLDSDYMNMAYNLHSNYSISYFLGTVGILYNKRAYPNEQFDS